MTYTCCCFCDDRYLSQVNSEAGERPGVILFGQEFYGYVTALPRYLK